MIFAYVLKGKLTVNSYILQASSSNESPGKSSNLKSKMTNSKVSNGDSESSDSIREEINLAIWPQYDTEKFNKILKDNPDLMTSKHGPMQETLLHR